MANAEIVLYSKPDCHLCEEVKMQLRRLQQHCPFQLCEVNILEDREAFDRFKDEIPVIFINGRKAFKFRLDETEFLKRLGHSAVL